MEQKNDSIIKEMLDDASLETPVEEEETKANEEAETQEEESATNNEEPVITEEQAREWGLHHSFVGKPISELGKAYRNLTADYTRKSQKLKELEKPDKETQEVLDDMPDPIEDIDGFKKWVKQQLAKDKVNPEIEAYIQREKEERILSAIKEKLPKDVNVEDVIKQWGMAGYVQDEKDYNYFMSRPEVFVNSVTTFYKAQELAQKEIEEAKKRGDYEVNKTARAFKKKEDVTSLNSSPRKTKKSGLVGELVNDLALEQKFKE